MHCFNEFVIESPCFTVYDAKKSTVQTENVFPDQITVGFMSVSGLIGNN